MAWLRSNPFAEEATILGVASAMAFMLVLFTSSLLYYAGRGGRGGAAEGTDGRREEQEQQARHQVGLRRG